MELRNTFEEKAKCCQKLSYKKVEGCCRVTVLYCNFLYGVVSFW